MSTDAVASSGPLSPLDQLRHGREIIQHEGQALLGLAERIGTHFSQAIELLFHCRGSVMLTGMGKAGLIAQKISATLSSTGTRSHYFHPGEAFHGDLGRVHRDDVVLVLSQSGETEEVVRLLPSLADFGVPIVAITSQLTSTLARSAAVILDLGPLTEVCPLGLAPSTSTTAMLALGDALALVTSRMRNFRPEDFARFHPGGSLGRKLSRVEDHMRPLAECRLSPEANSVRDVFSHNIRPGRRTGAIMLVSKSGKLTGIFTDSDLARLFENRREFALDGPIQQVMTSNPTTIPAGSLMSAAIDIMSQRKISELPVVNKAGKPVGLVDITDVASLFPEELVAATAMSAPPARSPSAQSSKSSSTSRLHEAAGRMKLFPKPTSRRERKR